MNRKLAEENNSLYQALLVGKEMKHSDRMGKEYYALYDVGGYTVYEWVESKINDLCGKDSVGLVSMRNVLFDLTDKHVFKVSPNDDSLFYVHKKRFKRFLKKAVQRHMIKG